MMINSQLSKIMRTGIDHMEKLKKFFDYKHPTSNQISRVPNKNEELKPLKEEFEEKLKIFSNHIHYLGEIYQKKDSLIEWYDSDHEEVVELREIYDENYEKVKVMEKELIDILRKRIIKNEN